MTFPLQCADGGPAQYVGGMSLVGRLVQLRRFKLVRQVLCATYNLEIPASVVIGDDFQLPHSAMGTVIGGSTTIGDRVQVFQQVTIGRADPWQPAGQGFVGAVIEDDVILCPGAKISYHNSIRVAAGTVVGANAVLTRSTGEWEIWAGAPAKKVGVRARL